MTGRENLTICTKTMHRLCAETQMKIGTAARISPAAVPSLVCYAFASGSSKVRTGAASTASAASDR